MAAVAHCFCPVLSGVKSRTRSCRPNAAKATPRNDAVSPCSLSSSSPLRVSLYPALRNLPTVQVVCSPKSFRRVHCTLRTAPPAFASLSALLIQLYNYRSSRPVPASSIIRASPALPGIFHRFAPSPLQTTIYRPLLILSCRHELLIYPSRSSRLNSGGGIPSRIRCLYREASLHLCLPLFVG